MTPHLSRKLVLETPQHASDGAGGSLVTWTEVGTVWADVTPATGRERRDGGATMSQIPTRIVVRGAPVGHSMRPKPDQRFRDTSRTYEILAVREADPMGRYLMCHTIEEVTS